MHSSVIGGSNNNKLSFDSFKGPEREIYFLNKVIDSLSAADQARIFRALGINAKHLQLRTE